MTIKLFTEGDPDSETWSRRQVEKEDALRREGWTGEIAAGSTIFPPNFVTKHCQEGEHHECVNPACKCSHHAEE